MINKTLYLPLPSGQKRTPDGHPIPPKWTSVLVAKTRGQHPQAIGRDEAGRNVYVPSFTHVNQAKEKKYTRLKSFMESLPKIVSKIQADAKKGKEEARVLDLVYKTGFRIDSGGNTRAKVKAFGASSLQGQHVKVTGNKIHFDFISKKGVNSHKDLIDSVLSSQIKNKGPNEPLFNTDYTTISKYWKTLTKKYLIKDLRLYMGTSTAIAILKDMPMPTTIKEYKAQINTVSDKVADVLQNTRAVAKGSYIMPEVFQSRDAVVKSLRVAKVSKKKNPIEGSGIPWLFLLGGIGIWWFLNRSKVVNVNPLVGDDPPIVNFIGQVIPPPPVVDYTRDYKES